MNSVDSSADNSPLRDFKLSVIVPVFNEQNTIELILRDILAVPLKKEVIVIDDGSTDETADYLSAFTHPDVRTFFHRVNRGKGAAVRTGLQNISGDIVIIQDADLEYPPSQYEYLLQPIVDGKADVVYGSRFLGTHRVFAFWHYFANRLLTAAANVFYDTMLTDMMTCYKIMRRDALAGIELHSDRFDIEPELTAKLFKNKKLRIVEMPITYYGRTYDEGKKIGWKDGISVFWALLKFRFMD